MIFSYIGLTIKIIYIHQLIHIHEITHKMDSSKIDFQRSEQTELPNFLIFMTGGEEKNPLAPRLINNSGILTSNI